MSVGNRVRGLRGLLFRTMAGSVLLVWLVTMGVLSVITFRRMTLDAAEVIEAEVDLQYRSLAQNWNSGLIQDSAHGDQYAREWLIYTANALAWPGSWARTGSDIGTQGDMLFHGAARLTSGPLEIETGNYLEINADGDTPEQRNWDTCYLPLDGVFSPEDVERMVTYCDWRYDDLTQEERARTWGEATGWRRGGLFWAEELVFVNGKTGREERFTGTVPNPPPSDPETISCTSFLMDRYRFHTAAPSLGTQERVSKNLAALDEADPQVLKQTQAGVLRSEGLVVEQWRYLEVLDKREDGYGPVELLCYFRYCPLLMTLRALWGVYLATLAAALLVAVRTAKKHTDRFATPILRLQRVAQSGSRLPERFLRLPSGIAEVDDLGRALAGLTEKERAAREALEAELERERELTRAVAHELKTPLSIQRAHAEALREDIAPEKRARYLGIIMDECDRMAALVGSLLDLSRLEAGAAELRREAVDLSALAAEVFAPLEVPAGRRGVRIRAAAAEGCTVQGDRGRLEQVISNLASNALRHCAPGGEIRASLERRERVVRLTVENDGAPIPEEQLPRLWDTFYRGDAARSREEGGAGLGLAIVRGIVELHGGACGAENIPGGVRFWCELPGGIAP